MFDSIIDDIKRYFQSGNMISRLIILNGLFFLILILVKIGLIFTGPDYPAKLAILTKYLAINENMWFNLKHPWVFITHAFTHFGFFHILFNMLMLYWFGRIVGDLLGDRHILPIYILGILAGILFFWISANFITPGNQIAYGASAGVMAIVMAAGFTAPDYEMHLILIGPVKIKFIVLALVIIDLLAISNMSNTGGSFAHIGGAIMGGILVAGLRNGYDLSTPINRWSDQIADLFRFNSENRKSRSSALHVRYRSNRVSRSERDSDTEISQHSSTDRLDEILDKIKEHGMSSLTDEERYFLERQSKK